MRRPGFSAILLCCSRAPVTPDISDVPKKLTEKAAKEKMGIFSRKRDRKCKATKAVSGEEPIDKLRSSEEADLVRFSPRTGQLECADCGLSFEADLALYQHCRLEHSESFVNTRCCHTQMYTLAAFAAHAETFHSKQHLCIRCHEFFDSVHELECHLDKHGAHLHRWAFFCILCGAHRRSDLEILSHFQSVHGMSEVCSSQYICRVPLEAPQHFSQKEQLSLLPCISVAAISDRLLSSLWNC